MSILNVNCLENLIICLTEHPKAIHNKLLELLEKYGKERKFLENHQLEELSKLHDAASHLKNLTFKEKGRSYLFENKW